MKVIFSTLLVFSLSSSSYSKLEFEIQDPQKEYTKNQLEKYDEKIGALSDDFCKLSSRDVFEKKLDLSSLVSVNLTDAEDANKGMSKANFTHLQGKHGKFRINVFSHAENCFIGTTTEIYGEDNQIVKYEEGPINLRKVTRVQSKEYVKGKSLAYILSFDTKNENYPDLYFETSDKRIKAKKIIDELMPLCWERNKLFRELHQDEKIALQDLQVAPSRNILGRPVRKIEEDTTQRASVLINGTKAFAARLKISEDAKRPQHSIRLQYLIFMADEAGMRLTNEMIKKAQDGVKIQVIIDALSPFMDVRDLTTRENTIKMYNNLMASGIPVYGFRCGPFHHRLIDEVKLSVAYDSKIYDHRPHEKFWIVDGEHGKKAVIGGMNIGNDYFRLNQAGFGFWRDQDLLVEGNDIIQDMINIFEGNAQTSRNNYLDPQKDTCFNKFDPVKERLEFQKFLMANTKPYELVRSREEKQNYQAHARTEILRIEDGLRDKIADFNFDSEPLKAARIVHNLPKQSFLHTEIEDVYLSMINNAKEEVFLSNAYFIPSPEIKKALRAAASRGVRVVVLTNSYQTNDVPPVALLARYGYKELVDENYGRIPTGKNKAREVEIYEWTGDIDNDGVLEQGTNHAKYIVADRRVAFIGSYNLDPRSRNINSEVGLFFEPKDGKLTRTLAEEFFNVDLKFARKVDYRDILSYRKPLHIMRATYLKLKGFQLKSKNSLVETTKQAIFYDIAKYDEGTW